MAMNLWAKIRSILINLFCLEIPNNIWMTNKSCEGFENRLKAIYLLFL